MVTEARFGLTGKEQTPLNTQLLSNAGKESLALLSVGSEWILMDTNQKGDF